MTLTTPTNRPALADVPVTVVGPDGLDALAADLATDVWRPAADTETEYRAALLDDGIPGRVRVISLAVQRADGSEHAYVIDLRDTPPALVARVLADVDVVGWNANFDEHALARADGLAVRSWYDAMLADSVTRAGRHDVTWYRSLADATRLAVGETLGGKGDVQLSYDLTSDLTADQIAYAAQDAVATRRVADWVRTRVAAANLDVAVELENGARPFINAMMMNGVPFDLEGYLDVAIAAKKAQVTDYLERLAALTEAKPDDPTAQMLLFAEGDADVDVRPVPSWNPNSKAELIAALNRWAEPEVRKYTGGRLLEATDPLRKNDLKQIGGEVVDVLLKLKAVSKEVTTYGAELNRYWRDGRFFSRYKQALVSTGRLASEKFNAQNLSKGMLPWMRTGNGRVLVYGDAGQAELRVVAHLSGDADMLAAFDSGEDFHTATAKSMFPNDDLDALAESDPATAKKRRTAAKAVNFGLAYGMAAGLLATNLTVAGVPTSKEDAQGYLAAYFAARPTMADWLQDRDAYVARVAANLPSVDWATSLRLYQLRDATEMPRRALRKSKTLSSQNLARTVWPTGPEGEELADDELAAFHTRRAAELDWAWSYEGAVALDVHGEPVGYFSTTASGRRRYFDIPMGTAGNDKFSGVITTALLDMCGTRKPAGRAYVDRFAAEHGLALPDASMWRTERLRARTTVVKAFEGTAGRALRWKFITGAIDQFGMDAMSGVFDRAAADCLRGTRNAYRNHPVQGTVADIMELAFTTITAGLPHGAVPVMSVHDSVIIECDQADADRVGVLVRDAIEGAMRHFCPSVRPAADVDIRTSLDDDDIVSHVPPADEQDTAHAA
jgi:DNA polymerase I-like protein with 3'-5' exonuclease and polymerase domains